MASRLILLLRIAAVIAVAGGAIGIAAGIATWIQDDAGPGFGTGKIFAAGLAFGGGALGLLPGLILWRAASAIRNAGPGLQTSGGRIQAVSIVVTAMVGVGGLAGLVLVIAAGHANLLVFGTYLGLGLFAGTAAFMARYVPERGLAKALLYVGVIGAVLTGLLAWVYGRS
jgi:hypothetical protein